MLNLGHHESKLDKLYRNFAAQVFYVKDESRCLYRLDWSLVSVSNYKLQTKKNISC